MKKLSKKIAQIEHGMLIFKEMTLGENDFEETVVGLYRMSEWIISLLQDTRYGRKQIISLALSYTRITDAIDLLCFYEQAIENGQDDLAHEYGMSYSDLMANIQENLNELHDDGIVMCLQ